MASSRGPTTNQDEVCEISRHDKAILNRIFNPGLPSSDISAEIERSDLCETVPEDDKVVKAKALEVEGVNAAEEGNIDMALNYFSEAIHVAPHWPSAYNNRAQALRLKGDTKAITAVLAPLPCSTAKRESSALEDLNMAVVLSKGEGKSACQAFTQRALIRRLDGDDEGALADFKSAANLGNEFAKQMLVALNPYAALCNQMLREVMTKLRTGQDTQ